jgi:hypothetical protein
MKKKNKIYSIYKRQMLYCLYIKCGTLQIDAGPRINIKRRLGSIAYTILLYLYLSTPQSGIAVATAAVQAKRMSAVLACY